MNSTEINLRGIAIGNGYLSNKWDIRSVADFMYTHGLYGKSEWDALRRCCVPMNTTYCDLSSHLTANRSSDGSPCGDLTYQMTQYLPWHIVNDIYNIYQSCYGYAVRSFAGSESAGFEGAEAAGWHNTKRKLEENVEIHTRSGYMAAYVNQFSGMNYGSTDAEGGFQCYMTNAVTNYLNQAHVREALHIPDYVQPWIHCR